MQLRNNESASTSTDDRDYLEDMYIDDPDSDHETARTLRSKSSMVSFRSAKSDIGKAEDFDMADDSPPTSPERSGADDKMEVDATTPSALDQTKQTESLDLVEEIRGAFRILDLVSEQGSGGLGELFALFP